MFLPPYLLDVPSHTHVNTHIQIQAHTQTQAGLQIAVLISKRWQLLMKVTSPAASA